MPEPRVDARASRGAGGTDGRASGRRGERTAFSLDPPSHVDAGAWLDPTPAGARHGDSRIPAEPEWPAAARSGRDEGGVDEATPGVDAGTGTSVDAPAGARQADGTEGVQGHDGERRPPLTPRVVVEQVVAHATRFEGDGRHAVHVRLDPPDLGAVRIDAVLDGRDLTLTIRAERESARELLLDGLPELREALVEHGLVPERVSVELDVAGGGHQAPDHRGARFSREAPESPLRRATARPSVPTGRITRDAVGVDFLV
jgi:flagellar hook-length control protein FliK